MEDEYLTYIREVLRTFSIADCYDGLFWTVGRDQLEHPVKFFARCSDFFYWGTSDLEPIEIEDVELLKQTRRDLLEVDGEWLLNFLFAARKRKMRPMRLAIGKHPSQQDGSYPNKDPMGIAANKELQDLFLACGPERDPASEG